MRLNPLCLAALFVMAPAFAGEAPLYPKLDCNAVIASATAFHQCYAANLAAARFRSKRRRVGAPVRSCAHHIYREWRGPAGVDRAGHRRYGPPAAPPLKAPRHTPVPCWGVAKW